MNASNKLPRPLRERAEGEGGLHAAEASAVYAVEQHALLKSFDLLATAPEGVARLRELIFNLASLGRLVPSNEVVSLERLDKVADFVMGQAPPGSECNTAGNGTIFVKTGEFGLLYPEIREWTTKPLKMARRGDVLICVVGATIGKLNLAIDCAIGRSVAAIRPLESLDSKYLYFSLMPFTIKLRRDSRGSAQGVIGKTELGNIKIRVPSKEEQSRIVTCVEELMQLCDALEAKGKLEAEQHARLVGALFDALANSESAHALAENWQRVAASFDLLLDRSEAVDALEQTLLQLAVRGLLVPQDPKDEPASELLKKIRAEKDHLISTGKLKRNKPLPEISEEEKPFELPQRWEWARFGSLPYTANTGLERGKELQSHSFEFLYFKMNNISNKGGVNFSEITRVNASQEELEKYALQIGDFLFNTRNSRELVGKTCVIEKSPEEAILFNNNILVCRFLNRVDPRFIDTWFRSSIGRSRLDLIKSATTNVCAIYQGSLFEFLCPIPPLAEQSRIVARVAELRQLCADLRARLTAARTTQTRLAEALVEQTA